MKLILTILIILTLAIILWLYIASPAIARKPIKTTDNKTSPIGRDVTDIVDRYPLYLY